MAAPTDSRARAGSDVSDPQVGEDEHVQHVRRRMTDGPVDVKELVRTWHAYAANSHNRAHVALTKGDEFGANLLLARAAVRENAAKLLLSQEPAQAALLMMKQAAAHVVRHPPLIGYDAAATSYTSARSWQWCAHQIDPTLPEIQPRWS